MLRIKFGLTVSRGRKYWIHEKKKTKTKNLNVKIVFNNAIAHLIKTELFLRFDLNLFFFLLSFPPINQPIYVRTVCCLALTFNSLMNCVSLATFMLEMHQIKINSEKKTMVSVSAQPSLVHSSSTLSLQKKISKSL